MNEIDESAKFQPRARRFRKSAAIHPRRNRRQACRMGRAQSAPYGRSSAIWHGRQHGVRCVRLFEKRQLH